MNKKIKHDLVFVGNFALAILVIVALIKSCDYSNTRGVQDPQIKKGEFPFKLIYRLEDEIITVEDTYICKYKGKDWGLDIGAVRTWKGYVKGTKRNDVLIVKDGEYEIVAAIGGYNYYMSLDDFSSTPYESRFFKCGPRGSISLISDEEALSLYDVEIISFEHAEPVKALAEEDDITDISYEIGGIW